MEKKILSLILFFMATWGALVASWSSQDAIDFVTDIKYAWSTEDRGPRTPLFVEFPAEVQATFFDRFCTIAEISQQDLKGLASDLKRVSCVSVDQYFSIHKRIFPLLEKVHKFFGNTQKRHAEGASLQLNREGTVREGFLSQTELLFSYVACLLAWEFAQVWEENYLKLKDERGLSDVASEKEVFRCLNELSLGCGRRDAYVLSVIKQMNVSWGLSKKIDFCGSMDDGVRGFYESPIFALSSGGDEDCEPVGIDRSFFSSSSDLPENYRNLTAQLASGVELSGNVLALFIDYCLHPEEFEQKAGRRDSQDSGSSDGASDASTVMRGGRSRATQT